MSAVILIVLVFFMLAAALGVVAYFTYKRKLRRAKAIERGLKMVPVLIHLPPPSSDTQGQGRDMREVMREKTSQAEVLYNLIAGTAVEGFRSNFYGQRHIALEVIAINNVVHFFVAVPVAMVSTVKKAVQTAYPGARLEEVEDHNIFNQEGRLAATLGGEMVLRAESAYPIATYDQLERDPMEALLTTISALEKHDGVAVQIMLRPADPGWVKQSVNLATGKRKGRSTSLSFTAMDLARAAVKSPDQHREEERMRMGGGPDISNLELAAIERVEEKTKHPGFEVLIRVLVSTGSVARSQQLLRDIATAFALFESPGMNGFKFLPALDVQGLVTAFIFRFFPPELKSNVLNSVELATIFHLPDSQFTPSSSIERQQSKEVDGPVQLSSNGLLFGYNDFRGVKKEIRLSVEDRRRHTYILGQTGTGKSTMLENLAVQDMINGNGFAFIDPHGDSAEKLLALVPKERAEDVIYFNPADTAYPLGLNLFEFSDPMQKDFIVQETINMLYKLYDPGHTGIIGPRYEHWYRNAALTLMSDPNGSTFIEIPKVFTDTEYLKQKFKYLRDPTVVDFWTKEMAQTSDYHKSEMLGWFVSKFGAFQNNEMMRSIIGQTKSSFNIRDVMDQKKILIVNLSKGRIGELNSQLLGMIFVIKFQAAAMSRADVPEDQRNDFSLYVDEFQNFSTDSFASILSEARKYRLNLIVANQFIGQLSDEIRDAVFGNIGTIVSHRMGPDDAEFMVKQFAPVFEVGDLVNIPNYHAAMRLMIGGLPSQPFSLRDSAPLGRPNLELGLAIKQLSAAKFGRSKAQVESEILNRMSGQPVGGVSTPMQVAGTAAMGALPGAAEAGLTAVGAVGPAAMPAAVMPGTIPAAIAPGAAVALPGMVGGPPPIGAPVAVPPAVGVGTPPVVVAAAVPTPGTLSISDITGGATPPAPSLDNVPVLAPEPVPAVPQPELIPQAAPVRRFVTPPPLGSGQPREDDPYANINVLGDLAPLAPAPIPEPVALPVVQEPAVAVEPLVAAEEEVTGPMPEIAPVPVSAIAAPAPAGEPAPNDLYANIDVLAAAPPQAASEEVAVAPVAAEAMPSEAMEAAPVPAPIPEPVQPAETVLPEEEFIHFVDPSAKAVFERPESPEPEVLDSGAPSLSGLPEGVQILDTVREPVAQPAVVAQSAVVPPAPASIPVPVPVPDAIPIEPPVVASAAPALQEPLPAPMPRVVSAPAPVDVVPVAASPTVAVAPVPVPMPVSAQALPAPSNLTLNSSLAEALQAAPEVAEAPVAQAPSPAPLAAAALVPEPEIPARVESGLVDSIESVADMLDEVQEAAKQKTEPVEPPVQAAVPAKVVVEEERIPEPVPEVLPEPTPEPSVEAVEVLPVPAVELTQMPEPEPEPEAEVEAEPKSEAKQPSSQEQIEKAEHEIDDLLSVSLIHSDNSPRHHRLPEPVEVSKREPEAQSGVVPKAAPAHPVKRLVPSSHGLIEERHGLKVIQPLEPIVPPKEEFARELATIGKEELAAAPEPKIPAEPVKPKPAPVLPAEPPEPEPAEPAIIKHAGEMLPEPPEAAMEDVTPAEEGLPQAESLAANEVAKARAEREAEEILQPAASAESEHEEEGHRGGKRKHRRGRGDKKAEIEPLSDNLAGKLIMPTGEKPAADPEPPKPEKPKKLAPGEVYVDDSGNVIIGE